MSFLKKNLKILSIFILVILVLFSSTVPVGAQTSSSDEQNPQLMVAKLYAERYHVDVNEALFRLGLQETFPDLQPAIAINEESTFGGLWIQHEPEYKIIIAFTQNGKNTIGKYGKYIPEKVAPYIQVKQVDKSLADLLKEQANLYLSLKNLNINIDSRVDVINNCVSIDVLKSDESIFKEDLGKGLFTKTDNLRINLVDALSQPTTDIYGGLTTQSPDNYDYSTFAFAVKAMDGTKGIVTCGHGSTSLYYNHVSLPLVGAAMYNLYWDCQWHTCPGLTVTNKIQTTSGGGTMDITSVVPRSSQSVGYYVFKYGRTTGLTAGMISSTTGNYFGCPTWIEVSNTLGYPNLLLPGDSGGPWFTVANGAAYGITSAGANNWQLAIYMAIDYISILGVGVMTSP
jgi:hypothetical protein